jgi:hypothetical protein
MHQVVRGVFHHLDFFPDYLGFLGDVVRPEDGFMTRSANTSKARGTCSSRTLVEKLVSSFGKGVRCPPMESTERALSAVRCLVPLKAICSRK